MSRVEKEIDKYTPRFTEEEYYRMIEDNNGVPPIVREGKRKEKVLALCKKIALDLGFNSIANISI
jgi:hypothetical protein